MEVLKKMNQSIRLTVITTDKGGSHKDLPCYVPELSDTVYTAKDFLEMCHNQEDLANTLFAAKIDPSQLQKGEQTCYQN